jgi:hypothetical protein
MRLGMRGITLVGINLVLAFLVAGASTSAADAATSVEREWTLRSLGKPAVRFSPRGPRERVTLLQFNLTEGQFREGRGIPYLLRIEYVVHVKRQAKASDVYLSGSTNKLTAMQVGITTRRRAGSTTLRADGAGFGGDAEPTIDTKAFTVSDTYINHVRLNGVRPGRNTVEVSLEQLGNLSIREIEILLDSGVIQTSRPPASLYASIEPMPPAEETRGGTGGSRLAQLGVLAAIALAVMGAAVLVLTTRKRRSATS